MSRQLKDPAFKAIARVGKALGHAHRLELLHLLEQSPRDVDALARGTARSIASTSQHLQILSRANLVDRERRGTHIVYSLADGVRQLLSVVESAAMLRDPALRVLQESWLHDHPTVELISEEDLRLGINEGSVMLLDVRPPEEYAYGHLRDALSIPLPELRDRMTELPRDQVIVAVCRGRWCTWADEAVDQLRMAGFSARRLDG